MLSSRFSQKLRDLGWTAPKITGELFPRCRGALWVKGMIRRYKCLKKTNLFCIFLLAFVFASHCQWCWLLLLLLCLLHTYSCSPGGQTRCPGMWAKIAECGPDQRRRGGRKNCCKQHLVLSAGLQWHSPVIELPLVIFVDSRGQVYRVFASRLLKKFTKHLPDGKMLNYSNGSRNVGGNDWNGQESTAP